VSDESKPECRESLSAELNRKQDVVLEQLDELNANILSLLEEFTVRLKGEESADPASQAREAA